MLLDLADLKFPGREFHICVQLYEIEPLVVFRFWKKIEP